MKPKISIIMPAHNASAFIAAAIASVQAQTYDEWELCVMDDASTDRTAELVQAMAAQDARIRYTLLPPQGRPSKVRNAGFDQATGDYISFLDADDCYFPDALSRLMQGFDEYPAAIAVYGFADYMNEQGEPLEMGLRLLASPTHDTLSIPSFYRHDWPAIVLGGLSCMLPGLLIPRKTLERIGPFDERFLAAEDYQFYVRLFLDNFEAVHAIPTYIYQYRVNAGSLTKSLSKAFEILESVLAVQKWLFSQDALPVEVKSYFSKAITHCYRYLARERILNSQPDIARQFLIQAFHDANVGRADWFRLCLPLLLRSFIPQQINYLLLKTREHYRQMKEQKQLSIKQQAYLSEAIRQSELQITLIQSLTSLDTWEAAIQQFLLTQAWSNPTVQPGWMRQYFQSFGWNRLFILVIYDKAMEVKGLLCLKQSRSRRGSSARLLKQLTFVGTYPNVVDSNTLLLAADTTASAVLPLVIQTLQQQTNQWDELDFSYVDDHDFIQGLANGLKPSAYHVALEPDLARPFVTLPATVEDYAKQRSGRIKKVVNNRHNRIARDFSDIELVFEWVTPQASAAYCQWFFENYIAYWTERGVNTEFHRYPNLQQFYTDRIASGDMQLTCLRIGEDIMSVYIGYWLPEQRYLLHLTSFNELLSEYSPGILHVDYLIQALIEKDIRLLDFGLGEVEYKTYFTNTKQATYHLQVCRTPVSQWLRQWDPQFTAMVKKYRSNSSV